METPVNSDQPDARRLPLVLSLATARPRATLAVALALLGLALAGIVDPWTGEPRLRFDPSVGALLARHDRALGFYEEAQRAFGSEDPVIVVLRAAPLFTADRLRRLTGLTEDLGALAAPGRVFGLANAPHPRGAGGRVEIVPFLSDVPADATALAALRERAVADPVVGGSLVSTDGAATAILVHLDGVDDAAFLARALDARIEDVVARWWGREGEAWWLSGGPIIKAATSRLMRRDLERFLPLSFAFGAVVFFLAFRALASVLVALGTVLAGVVWTLGAIGWAGYTLNMNTASVPILVVAIGCAYVTHVVAEYHASARAAGVDGSAPAMGAGGSVPAVVEGASVATVVAGTSAPAVAARALGRVWVPVSVAALTTVGGFVSLTLSPLEAIRQFGGFAAAGTVMSALAALVLAPAMLASRRLRVRAASERAPGWLDALAAPAARLVVRRRHAIVALTGVVTVLSLIGLVWVRVDMDFLENFDADAPVRRNAERASAWFGGASTFTIVVEAPRAGAFRRPRNLKALYDFERWLEAQPEIGDTSSLASLAEGVYRAYRATDEAAAESLKPSELVARLLPMVSREDLRPFVDEEFRRATIHVRTGTASSAGLAHLLERIEWRASALPRPLVAQATGGAVLIGRAIDDISRSQTLSLGAALVLVLAILAWWARSLRDAAVLLVPNVVPIVAYFGALGWTGVPLDNSTALLACMLLGIAVDDTVHYAERFRDECRQSADAELCTARTLRAVGPAITYSTVVLVIALLLLSTSGLRMLARFGAFGAAGLALAWLLDVTLTPVLCLALAARRA